MVKRSVVLLAAIISANVFAQKEDSTGYDTQTLKYRLKNGADERASAADRLKAARGDKSSLKILQESDLNYKLPNGQYVLGMLLPNGTVSPAIKTKLGTRPACVSKRYDLVLGTWDEGTERIICNIPASELAYIDDSVRFESSVDEPRTTVSNKYSANNSATERGNEDVATASRPANDAPRQEVRTNSRPTPRSYASTGGYVPAPRNNTTLNSKAGTIESNASEFGIPRGTWIRAELVRHATSADSTNIEFVITESVIGKFKTLEVGTVLFASKSFNSASRRLEALTSVAVTPEGNEIQGIRAYVHAADQSAGLSGTIVRDREGEALSAGTNSVLTAAADAIPGGAGLATGVVSNLSGALLDNEKDHASQAPRAFIQVAPQTVWLKTAQKI